MELAPTDLHAIFNPAERRLKLFDAGGTLLLECEARNRTVAHAGYGHFSPCPPGEFLLGQPIPKRAAPFGLWFTPILDDAPHGPMAQHHRAGIGLHGGGSGLPDPYAPEQGWVMTEGCIRLQNRDNAALVAHLHQARARGGKCYLTVLEEG